MIRVKGCSDGKHGCLKRYFFYPRGPSDYDASNVLWTWSPFGGFIVCAIIHRFLFLVKRHNGDKVRIKYEFESNKKPAC
ncbi:MAG: hypothetical protein A3D53_03260 [Candidatus Magasanikbacteria bacterium RIFCSPHIGHO2_02_FULL_45_10]|uniref:Uncharacterized protein n=1 Tax=Candidatus Magasanikbacteria bacterium RIFCSPHIGHO2_02_FULL_45_10 TaxID=1798679 RepID=A0A1F6MAZ5_9BACT|nr:MAG: hypothetical protein A3D53_03260 [Candidatus Magasanikbacteria bacterium RIFCSPHIGHO2_02_FULL_45_10]